MKAYLEYFDLSERKGWRIQDLPWNQPQLDRVSSDDRKTVAATSVIESGVPHYARSWELVDGFKQDWELAQFVTLWAGEEERHNVTLNRLCAVLGVSPHDDYRRVAEFDFPPAQKAACPSRCYSNIPGMLAYALLQELVTWKYYASASAQSKSALVREAFHKIGQDEMRHHVWYRDALKARYEVAADRAWFVDQIVASVAHFQMPHGIYHLREKFFDEESAHLVGKLGMIDIKLKAARSFSFDHGLLKRLATARPDDGRFAE
jgi:fatty acid desaturase